MFSAAFKSLQLVSRQNVRGVVCNLSRPANVLGIRSYSYESRPTDIGNQPNHIAPGILAEEGARNEDIETYWKHREFDHVARLPPAPTKYDGMCSNIVYEHFPDTHSKVAPFLCTPSTWLVHSTYSTAG